MDVNTHLIHRLQPSTRTSFIAANRQDALHSSPPIVNTRAVAQQAMYESSEEQ
jgi:hypothetical protein